MNLALPRPSNRRLEQLLETNPARFEKYLERYPDIADLFENNNPLTGIAETARRAFDAAIDVPNDLAARMRSRIRRNFPVCDHDGHCWNRRGDASATCRRRSTRSQLAEPFNFGPVA
jgi:hypothetical protein